MDLSDKSISPDRIPRLIFAWQRLRPLRQAGICWFACRCNMMGLLAGILISLLLAPVNPAQAQIRAQASIQGVVEARQNVLNHKLILIDIRRPEEWAETGIADIATEIDMRSPDFLQRIRRLQQANPEKAIGFICAVGSRSARLAHWFIRRGQANIVDVNAGMVGRNGWLANRLPIRAAPGTHPSRN